MSDNKSDTLSIPGRALSNLDLLYFAKHLPLPNFKGVFMRNELPPRALRNTIESGIMNFNKSNERGSHWVSWYCHGNKHRYYFDSFGQDVPLELEKYLKSAEEYDNYKEVIRRNAIVLQHIDSSECGRLCLFVLKLLSDGWEYDDILQILKVRFDLTNGRPSRTRKTK